MITHKDFYSLFPHYNRNRKHEGNPVPHLRSKSMKPSPQCSAATSCPSPHFKTILFAAALALSTQMAFAQANFVYHERTTNDVTGGTNITDCAVPTPYVDILLPNASQDESLVFKVEFTGDTDTTVVYYTTDGSPPSGSMGVATSESTQVAPATYQCVFTDGENVIDVCNAIIPLQASCTTVKYIIGAWSVVLSTPEVFANSGTGSLPECNEIGRAHV